MCRLTYPSGSESAYAPTVNGHVRLREAEEAQGKEHHAVDRIGFLRGVCVYNSNCQLHCCGVLFPLPPLEVTTCEGYGSPLLQQNPGWFHTSTEYPRLSGVWFIPHS